VNTQNSVAVPAGTQVPGTPHESRAALHVVDDAHRHAGEMDRAERIGFWMYVAMGILCTAVLVAAAVSALVS
jgi:hypothetical protein